MNKKAHIGGIIVVIIMVIALFVGTNKDSSDTGNPIKIGATLALSGNLAYIGEQERNGLVLAIEEINEHGGVNGRPLRLIAEDNKGVATDGVTNVNKLLHVDDVDIMYSAFTHVITAIHELIIRDNTPFLYSSSLPDFAQSHSLTFRDYFDNTQSGERLSTYINEKGYKKFAYLLEQHDSCKQFTNTVKENTTGIITIEEVYDAKVTDFRTQLLKIKQTNPDAIVVCAFRHNHLIMPQLAELDMITIPTLQVVAPFLPIANTPEMKDLFEQNNTITAWFGYAPGSVNNIQKEFVEKYTKRFSIEPNSDAVYAYDDIYVLADALEECTTDTDIDKECFREEMLKTNYDGIGGNLRFDEDGVSFRDVLLMRVEDGEWVEI